MTTSIEEALLEYDEAYVRYEKARYNLTVTLLSNEYSKVLRDTEEAIAGLG